MWWRMFVVISASALTTGTCGENDSRIVRTSSGEVRGYRDPDGDIFSFYGIPYATAPTGPNKFKAPLPPPAWLQPLDAVDTGIMCPQVHTEAISLENRTVQENCLVANVHVPDTKDKNLPVLVIIHGGGFQLGLGNWFASKGLIRTKKLVVVTFNYRLGIHGFLCLGTADAPGNAGMKDQVALLRWVKRNIASFGGNPDDVTISGGSAGSASVDLLLLSKSARGLFNKAIAESGSHLAVFAVQRDPIENAKNFAKRFNFTKLDDLYALQNFYTTASFELLTIDSFMNLTDAGIPFSPCVEHKSSEDIFLDNDPVEILKSGKYIKVPLLYGFANMEGLLRIDTFETWKIKMNENFADFVPANLQFKNNDVKQEVAKKIKEFYFGDKPVSNENILSYVDYFTDIYFGYSTLKSVQLQVGGGHNKIYLYEYSYVDDSFPVVPHTNVRGATHCAQTMAVLDMNTVFDLDETNISEEYKKVKSVIRELWTNFIYTGAPVPEGSSLPQWPPVDANGSPHMSLGQTVELKGSLLEHRVRFWDDIYNNYYRPPMAPPIPPSRHSEL